VTRSSLYVGHVLHRRFREPAHEFTYPVWYALLDLDEVAELGTRLCGFSHNRLNLTGFDDRDHMGSSREPVRRKLVAWMREQGVTPDAGRITLLTHLRIFGHVFNPVAFFFVHDRDEHLRHVVAEVNNTFGETFCYLLEADGSRVRDESDKVLHVSPFQPQGGSYRFRLAEPGPRAAVHIDLLRGGDRSMSTSLTLRRRELSSSTLLRTVLRHPHLGLWTLGLIHYQALRLWLKKAPFFTKPERPPGAWRTRHGRV
jgi:DUF1365 family protein